MRNFFRTGVISQLLENGNKVVVLTPYCGHPVFNEFKHPNLYFEPLIESVNLKWNKFFIEMEKAAIFNKTVHIRYKYRITGRAPNRIIYFLRLFFLAPLRFAPGIKTLIRRLDFWVNPEIQHDYLFEKYRPDLVFSTAAGGDVSVIKSAKRYGVKSVDMPKSWDNLSKFLFNAKADYLIVWSEFMKKRAVEFQGYKEDEMIVTGVPQFDYYTKKEKLLSREEFCRQFDFDPKKKIIFYGSGGGRACREFDYIELLHYYLDNGLLKNVQVLVRPHMGYQGDAEKLAQAKNFNNFVVDATDTADAVFKDRWDTSEAHLNHLFNSLSHADVCVNIASTLTLDASACGTPVININFDVKKDVDPHWSTKRAYKTDYVDAIVKSGGTWMAESEEKFLEYLRGILEENFCLEKKKERASMVDYFLYKLDGRAAERIAVALTRIANQKNYENIDCPNNSKNRFRFA